MNSPNYEESAFRLRKGVSVLFSAVAATALVLACGVAPAFAQQVEPRVEVGPSGVHVDDGVNRVDVNPGGTRVDTPGAHVDVRPQSHVLVCANGVRVVVHTGQAPNCPQPPPAPPVPEPPAPQPPAPAEPAPPQSREAPPAAPVQPVPAEPTASEPESTPERAPVEPEPEVAPELPEPAPEASPAPPESPAPEPPAEPPADVQQELLVNAAVPAPAESASGFTPVRTMAVVAIVAAGAATGAGRAMASLNSG